MFLKAVLHSFGCSSQLEPTFGRTWLLSEYHLFNGPFVLTFESSDTEYTASSIVILPVFCLRFSASLTRYEFDFHSVRFSCLCTMSVSISSLVGDFLYRLPEDEPPGSKHVEDIKN